MAADLARHGFGADTIFVFGIDVVTVVSAIVIVVVAAEPVQVDLLVQVDVDNLFNHFTTMLSVCRPGVHGPVLINVLDLVVVLGATIVGLKLAGRTE
jgi:hypothetical protein